MENQPQLPRIYRFKRDYAFQNAFGDQHKNPMPFWNASEGDTAIGTPVRDERNLILLSGIKMGLVEAEVLEEADVLTSSAESIAEAFPYRKKPFFLAVWWNNVRWFFYHIFRAKYYIMRQRIEPRTSKSDSPEPPETHPFHGRIIEEHFLVNVLPDRRVVWRSEPDGAILFSFFSGVMMKYALQKGIHDSQLKIILQTKEDADFIHGVSGGIKNNPPEIITN